MRGVPPLDLFTPAGGVNRPWTRSHQQVGCKAYMGEGSEEVCFARHCTIVRPSSSPLKGPPPPPLLVLVAGEGVVVFVDGARFLPANCTISKVVVSLWSSDKKQLVPQYYEVRTAVILRVLPSSCLALFLPPPLSAPYPIHAPPLPPNLPLALVHGRPSLFRPCPCQTAMPSCRATACRRQ